MTAEQSRGIRYLLGKLPEAEADALAEEFFTSDATFSEIEEAENSLIEAYLDDDLAADDRQRFEALFRSSRQLTDRIELERDLRARGHNQRPSARRAVSWLPWAAALAFGVVGGGAALQANRGAARIRVEAASRESALTARLGEQDERLRALEQRLADRKGPAVETWPLAAGSERTGGSPTPFAATTAWVCLRLPQDEAPAGASYRARLTVPEGRELFVIDGLSAASDSGGAFVDVFVPGGLIPRGTYVVSLVRVGAKGPQRLRPYSFSVGPR